MFVGFEIGIRSDPIVKIVESWCLACLTPAVLRTKDPVTGEMTDGQHPNWGGLR